ncbi:methyltransferase family protein [Verrucomicrobiota bacterium sgz303538]
MHKIAHSRSFHLRGAVGAIILLPAAATVLFSPPVAPEGSVLDWGFDMLGWVFFIVYATFRIWATLYVGGRKDRILQTEGIYSATRNPLYVGSACLAISAAFFFQSILLLALAVGVLAFYSAAVVRSEEEVLRQLFGTEFDNYVRQTPRFFPSFANYRTPQEVVVNIAAFRRETRRLLGAATLPIIADLVATLRTSPNWPHVFSFL